MGNQKAIEDMIIAVAGYVLLLLAAGIVVHGKGEEAEKILRLYKRNCWRILLLGLTIT